jgi:endonuclease III
MNPFASFAFGEQKVIDPLNKRPLSEENRSDQPPIKIAKPQPVVQKKRLNTHSSPHLMLNWWQDLHGLTSNYPFGVLITGVLGSQCRDIVTIAALRKLANLVDNDISPQNIGRLTVDTLESAIKTCNYCFKKANLILQLSILFQNKPVPSTSHGLLAIPG